MVCKTVFAGYETNYLHLTVGSLEDLTDMSLCTVYNGPGLPGQHILLFCDETISGRFLRVSLKYPSFSYNSISMAEMYIYVAV
jgi:hypothetical protein